jgi:molybdate transport system substrate-binding protein
MQLAPVERNPMRRSTRIALGIVLSLLFPAIAQAAEIRLLASNAMAGVMEELTPAFEKATGHKLVAVYEPTNMVMSRIKNGETSDVILVIKRNVEELTASGKVVPDSAVNIAKTNLGVAVKAGATKPDISTPEAFKATMLAAKSIALSEVGASGIHVAKVLEQLGIAEQMKTKTIIAKGAARTAELAAKGEVEIAMQMKSELLVPGADYVGPLPGNLAYEIVLTAGVSGGAKEPAAAKALIDFLASHAATPSLKKLGMERL